MTNILARMKKAEKEIDLKIIEERKHPFYAIDEYARVFAGFRKGYPYFSEDLNEAKALYNEEQLRHVKRGVYLKVERIEVKDLL